MSIRLVKFSFNILLIALILVIGFEFSSALAQGLDQGGSGLNVAGTEDVSISSDIDKRPLGAVILAMVNYFIGFLGFIAVIMFVYAGVLWVVAGGNDDQIGKAKNIMTYSALGLLIVILSYSIVRFITGSAGGGQTCATDADCPDNGICNAQNICEINAEGGNSCQANADCSQGFTCSNGICKLPIGMACLASKDCAAGQYCSDNSTCQDGGSQVCKVNSDCDAGEKCDAFGFCHNSDGISGVQCSDNTNCATGYVCNQDKSQCEIQGTGGKGGIQGGENEGLTLESLNKLDGNLTELLKNLTGLDAILKTLDLSQAQQDQLSAILIKTDLKGKIEDFKAFLTQNGPFNNIIQGAFDRLLAGWQGLLSSQAQLAELKTLMPESAKTLAAWDEASSALSELIADSTNPLKLQQFESKYKKLKDLVLSFPVVQSKIKASPGQGNAPLQVVFDGLDSFDPTGGTISDYKWSFLDSKGNLVSLGNSPVVTYEFSEPNTYNVRLQVSTNNKDKEGYKVAMDGVSNVLIKVSPPESKIAFRINEMEAKDVFSVTQEEAKKGIKFDPSITVPGLGKSIVKYEWFYGDTLTDVRSTPTTVIHSYPKPGEYFVTLKVTDNQGVSDKRVVKLMIKSLAADITTEPEEGDVNTEFRFRGIHSRSDNGLITGYEWRILDAEKAVVAQSSKENFFHTFERPGTYQLELVVTDSTGAQDKATQDFTVMSREPVANFSYAISQPNHPNTLLYDASQSYDPDKGDSILYSWDFDGDGQFEIVDAQFPNATYTYRRNGQFKAILQVKDAFGKSSQVQKDIAIDSILSADIQTDKKVAPLNEEVAFKAINSNAVAFVWDFGDGQTANTDQTTVTHMYTQEGKYTVKLTFFDQEDNSNETTYLIFVAEGDSPVAVGKVSMNGEVPPLIEDLCGPGVAGYQVNRAQTLAISAADSINRDGSSRLLGYNWRWADGAQVNKRDFTQRFTELSAEGECISLDLTVRDEASGKVSNKDTLNFKVINQAPTVRDLVVEQEDQTVLLTPIKVKVKLVGATDADGQVVKYRWWYYREGFESERLGLHSTSNPQTDMIITAQGEPDLKNKYYFVAEVIDNDGGSFVTDERFNEANYVEVTNGPNVSPVAEFTMDKTTVSTGDTVAFISKSYDPQGDTLADTDFQWDFDGDGSFDDRTSGAQVSHLYTTPGEFEVRLRVTHRGLTSTVRQKVTVLPTNSYPQASFSYSVVGNQVSFNARPSVADKDLDNLSLTYAWDFDIREDADGNGINDDDVQSTEVEPTFTYSSAKLYRVRLTVNDSTGMQGVTVRDVDLNLSSADRELRTRHSLRLSAPNQPITLLDVAISPYQLEKGSTADILATVHNADNSVYTGSVYFELLDGTGTFSPSPTNAVDSTAQTVFTAVDSGTIRIRVTATDTYYGDISEELFINVQ